MNEWIITATPTREPWNARHIAVDADAYTEALSNALSSARAERGLPAETLFQTAFEEGIHYAAQDLMDRLRYSAGVTDDNWNGGNVVETVDSWLQEHDIDTSVPEADDDDEEDDDDQYVKRVMGIPQYGDDGELRS